LSDLAGEYPVIRRRRRGNGRDGQKTHACISGSTVDAAGDIKLLAQSNAIINSFTVGGSFSAVYGKSSALSLSGAGSGSYNTVKTETLAYIDRNSVVTTTNSGDVLKTRDISEIVSDAGGFAVSLAIATKQAAAPGKALSIGAAVSDNDVRKVVKSYVEDSTVTADGRLDIDATSTDPNQSPPADRLLSRGDQKRIDSFAIGGAVAVGKGQKGLSGSGAGAGGRAKAIAKSPVSAYAANSAQLSAGNDVTIKAISNYDATTDSYGISGGLGAIGGTRSVSEADGSVSAYLDGTISTARDVFILVDAHHDADADAEAIAGGLAAAGAGSESLATASPTLRATADGSITATRDVVIRTLSKGNADANSKGIAGGDVSLTTRSYQDGTSDAFSVGAGYGVGVGVTLSDATFGGSINTKFDAVLQSANSLSLTTDAELDADSFGEANGGGLGASGQGTQVDTVISTATITATQRNVTLETRSSNIADVTINNRGGALVSVQTSTPAANSQGSTTASLLGIVTDASGGVGAVGVTVTSERHRTCRKPTSRPARAAP